MCVPIRWLHELQTRRYWEIYGRRLWDISKKKAADIFKVNRPMLVQMMLRRTQRPVGYPTVLRKSKEQIISDEIAVVANWRFPLAKADIWDVMKKKNTHTNRINRVCSKSILQGPILLMAPFPDITFQSGLLPILIDMQTMHWLHFTE